LSLHLFNASDTIVAVSSAPGKSLRAIVRLSGPEAVSVVASIARGVDLPSAHRFTVHQGSVVLDDVPDPVKCLFYVMPAPSSFTREDLCEIHTVGSLPVLSELLATIVGRGVRVADPGEFTRRAFLNGRINISQAEAVLKIIDASSSDQLKSAVSELNGAFSIEVGRIKNELADLLARIEAAIDFSDQDVDLISDAELRRALRRALVEMHRLASAGRPRDLFHEGFRVALAGRTNVGKSSLFNALLETSRALVASHAGTTRDFLEERLDVEDVPVVLADTAGNPFRTTDPAGALDLAAFAMTFDRISFADLVLFVTDVSTGVSPEEVEYFSSIQCPRKIVVLNKADLAPSVAPSCDRFGCVPRVATSAVTGQGLDDLRAGIVETSRRSTAGMGGGQLSLNVRQQEALRAGLTAVSRALQAVRTRIGLACVAGDVREALDHLGTVAGHVLTDDVLDLIFSRFCVGK